MKVARVRVYWNLSPSDDVVLQNLHLFRLSGDESFELEPFVSQFEFDAPEAQDVRVELTAEDDAGNVSEATVLEFNVGDLTAPLPPFGLGWEVVSVSDVEPE